MVRRRRFIYTAHAPAPILKIVFLLNYRIEQVCHRAASFERYGCYNTVLFIVAIIE